MSERDLIQETFDSWAKASGFEKKAGSWYRTSEEVVAVSNLQKSQYGRQYFVNQAFWLRSLGDERYPKYNKCHIRLRLGSLVDPERESVDDLLDLDCPIEDENRARRLASILDGELLSIIERGASLAGLRRLLDEGAFRAAVVGGPAQEALARS